MFNPRFIGILKHPGYNGGGDGGSQPTQSNVVNTNIPEYAQPYVENMLGATQEQLFNINEDGSLGSLKPYNPYSSNLNDYVVPFSPLQQQAQAKTANLSMPGQFNTGSNLALQSGIGSGQMGTQAAQAGNQYNQMATSPNAIQAFMNPYIQASLTPTLEEMQRQYGITGTQQQGNATRAGAFGGSREALMAAENQRNKNMAMNKAIGEGYDKAFQAAQQAQQFGSTLGLQGLQTGLTGMAQAGQAGATLGQLGTSQLGAAQGIINTQNQMGQQQQAQEQQKVNQAIQNYATAQQYPLMQLGTMSNMLRGLPMQASTTQQYQANPSALSQGIGIAGALGSLGQSGIFGGGGKKEGGMVNSYAEGGIASYGIGGKVKADMERLPTEKLMQLQETAKGIQLSQIKEILNDRAQGAMQDFAPGGIVAFAEGTPKDYPDYNSPAEEPTSMLDRYLDKVKNQKMGKMRILNEDVSDFLKRAGERNEITKQIDDLTPGVFSPRKIWDKESKAQQAEYDAKIAELKAKRAAIPSFVNNESGGGFDANAKSEAKPAAPPSAKPAVDPNAPPAPPSAKPAVDPNAPPAPPSAKPIVDPNKSILNTGQTAENPAFSMANMEKYAAGEKDKAAQAYMDQVKNAPMSKEGQELYDSYKDKVEGAKTKEEQRFWMHSALFFARLGSTPGPVAVAALTALKDQLPEYIKDKDALEEYNTKTQKAMYELSNAEMLKRQGQFEAGEKARVEAIKNFNDFYNKASEIEYRKKAGDASLISAKNRGATAGLGEEKLDLATTSAIQDKIKDRIKEEGLDRDLKTYRGSTSQTGKNKFNAAKDRIKEIENEMYDRYKQPRPNPIAAPKGKNAKDPLDLGI
jgi:hypothetical protein